MSESPLDAMTDDQLGDLLNSPVEDDLRRGQLIEIDKALVAGEALSPGQLRLMKIILYGSIGI